MKLPTRIALFVFAAFPELASQTVLDLSQMKDWTIAVAQDASPSEHLVHVGT